MQPASRSSQHSSLDRTIFSFGLFVHIINRNIFCTSHDKLFRHLTRCSLFISSQYLSILYYHCICITKNYTLMSFCQNAISCHLYLLWRHNSYIYLYFILPNHFWLMFVLLVLYIYIYIYIYIYLYKYKEMIAQFAKFKSCFLLLQEWVTKNMTCDWTSFLTQYVKLYGAVHKF